MVGNDVVDLGDPETAADACHPRFDRRVFADAELAELAASAAPGRARWILWAAKEAAYKLARRDDASTVFSPPRFAVRLVGRRRAIVSHGARSFAVTLEVSDRRVHAVAIALGRGAGAPGSLVSAVERIEAEAGEPGAAARALAIATLAPRLGVSPGALAIGRVGRVPRLLCRGRATPVALSLSHHGRFVAFAAALGEPSRAGDRAPRETT